MKENKYNLSNNTDRLNNKFLRVIFSKQVIYILLIIIIGACLRFWALGQNPSGVTNDEASLLYSAYSIFKTGRDIHHIFLPSNFVIDNSFSPVPIYISAPFVGWFGLNSFTGRLPFALAGTMSIYLIYLICEKLVRNKSIALISALCFALSPWAIFFSRVAYEGILSVFFGLLGTYIFLNNIEKGRIYWSIPFYFLAFYCYHALKIFYIVFIPFLVICYWRVLIVKKRQLLIFLIGLFLILISFSIQLRTQDVSRQKILIWNDLTHISQIINGERQVNIAPWALRVIFSNKLFYISRVIRENYLEAFSPQFLLLYGETGGLAPLYGVMSHGVLYLTDIIFIIIGILWLIKDRKFKQSTLVIFGWLLLAPLPSAVSVDKSYALRSIQMLPPIVILFSLGVYKFWMISKQWSGLKKTISYGLIAFIYIFLVSNYIYTYFFRFVVYGADAWFRSSRDVVTYMLKNESKYQQINIANDGNLLIQLAFYKPIAPSDMWQLSGKIRPKVGKINFIGSCIYTKGNKFDPKAYLPVHTLYIVPEVCHKETKPFDDITQVGEPLRVIWKFYEN